MVAEQVELHQKIEGVCADNADAGGRKNIRTLLLNAPLYPTESVAQDKCNFGEINHVCIVQLVGGNWILPVWTICTNQLLYHIVFGGVGGRTGL